MRTDKTGKPGHDGYKLILIEDPREGERFLFETDGERGCFLVSDIKSKMEAERRLLQKTGFLSGTTVFRMRDFLKELFERTCPDWQTVPKNFFKQFFLSFITRQNAPANIQNPSEFLTSFEECLPLLSHPESPRLLKEWFAEKGTEKPSLLLMEKFFNLVQEKKWITEGGIKGLLFNKLPNFKGAPLCSGRIVADLGVHFDSCEQEILKTLASFTDVTVLIPLLKQRDLQKTGVAPSLRLYKLLRESAPPSAVQTIEKNHGPGERTQFFKAEYDSALEEVKAVTVQVRRWLDEGVKERDIALLAPDMESCWFCLEPYLRKENIRVRKSAAVPLGDFPEIIFWTASLNTHIGRTDFPRLESWAFHKNPKMPFFEFQSRFFRNPGRDLSQRNFLNKNRIKDPGQEVTGRDFIKWALSFWPEGAGEDLFDRISALFQNVPLGEKLSYKRWMDFLETGLSRREKEIEREREEGISCLSLNALNSVRASHVIVMDLSEESLRRREEIFLNQKDLERFSRELAFPLSDPKDQEKETALQWFFQSSVLKTAIISFAAGDFTGEVRAPSAFFLLFESFYPAVKILPDRREEAGNAPEDFSGRLPPSGGGVPMPQPHHKQTSDLSPARGGVPLSGTGDHKPCSGLPPVSPNSPRRGNPNNSNPKVSDRIGISSTQTFSPRRKEAVTVWDSLKQRGAEEILRPRLSPDGLQKTIQALNEDREGLSAPFAPGAPPHLSAGRLNKYGACGFLYAASYIFHLRPAPFVEWEISPLKDGDISHRFLQKLLFEAPDLEISDEKTEELAKETLSERVKGGEIMNTKQDIIAIEKLKFLGRIFLEKERERRGLYPSLQPREGEKEIDCRFNEKTGRLDREGKIPFKGYIDRVDFDSKNKTYVIWDYKRSVNSLTHIGGWLKKSDFQLTIYAEAVEKGLVEGLPPAPVSAIAYYGLKEFKFKGYVDKTGHHKEIFGSGNQAAKDPKVFEKHREKTSAALLRLVSDMKRGRFFPKPKDHSSCDNCHWKKWCRAVHLNY